MVRLSISIKSKEGLAIVDDIHIDGLITGDMEGNFGLVRTIEEFDTQPNETGVMYDVAIIHHETWFNLTGITALPNSDLGAGAHHNDSYYYDAVQAHWDNRTIRNIWTQTGPDPSSGDEYPANSPIETPLEVLNQRVQSMRLSDVKVDLPQSMLGQEMSSAWMVLLEW